MSLTVTLYCTILMVYSTLPVAQTLGYDTECSYLGYIKWTTGLHYYFPAR